MTQHTNTSSNQRYFHRYLSSTIVPDPASPSRVNFTRATNATARGPRCP
ncbi:MAG: hypothetical protein R3F34_00595 [Planctomycetota bacterium]